jgi:hypothetical protein
MPATEIAPAVGPLQIGDDAQEGGFPAARRPDEGDEIAPLHRQIDVGERVHGAVAGLEA